MHCHWKLPVKTASLQDKEGGEGADKQEFDEFMGSDAGMFAGGQYDEDDKEADRVWESIDNFMDERRRVRAALSQSGLWALLCRGLIFMGLSFLSRVVYRSVLVAAAAEQQMGSASIHPGSRVFWAEEGWWKVY